MSKNTLHSNEIEYKKYHPGILVIVANNGSRGNPWYFDIIEEETGVTHHFRGMPNKCSTKAQALKRAWYRSKWIHEGTYKGKYVGSILNEREPEK